MISTTERFPSLVETSKNMGKIPTSLGTSSSHEHNIDWLPVDIAARSILELALSRLRQVGSEPEAQLPLVTFNLANPAMANWKEILAAAKEHYSSREKIQLEEVSYRDWVTELSEMSNSRRMREIGPKYPAVKMLDFFEALSSDETAAVKFSTDKSVSSSKALAEARPVDAEMMARWLNRWVF